MKMNKDFTWFWLGLLAALGAAGVAIFGKLATQRGDVVAATTLRSVIMTVMLVGILLVRQRGFNPIAGDKLSLLWITLAGVCGALSWLAYFYALRIGQAGSVAAVDRLSVVFVFVIAALALGEKYTWQGWLGMALVIGGIYLIATSKVVSKVAPG